MKKSLFRICFILLISSITMYGARPMINDDARVVDRHSCQLETWGLYNGDIAEYWIVPGCNLFLDMEISLGGMMSNAPIQQGLADERFGGRQLVTGVKKIFKDVESDGYSFGLALGNVYNFKRSKYRNEYYIYAPISAAFFDNTLLLHSNIGYKLKRDNGDRQIYNVGLGLEQEVSQRLWILGEFFYERFDTLKYQLGLRIWLIQDRIQLDGTYGNAFSGRESWVSLGLRFLSPPIF
ncbi:hypothetical protein OQH61_02560 [Helicobacter sp. MIT 21-1697]|uniref:hypothetical protein n=1 Tax=Helicobacter sp. MIT 21-1697 TaxID=2993733 RepID=UPI00224A9D8F|nr:hypothetical protein [Helicobacter sp. MIT 21-1697]MCX2716613.1 hypothetical protein [Helicobacter sp. MIT 21-1697]